LYIALLKAFFASCSDTHSNSNSILHGHTVATYSSTDHFQDPIGTSDAFLVTGLCGNILIHNFQLLFK